MSEKPQNPRTLFNTLKDVIQPLSDGETALRRAQEAVQRATAAHDDIDKLAERIMADTSQGLQARKIRAAEVAMKRAEPITKLFEQATESIYEEIERVNRRLEASVAVPPGKEQLASEIRTHLAMVEPKERARILESARKSNDTLTLRAIVNGPAYLSGLEQTNVKSVAESLYDPEDREYLGRLLEANERLPGLKSQFDKKVAQVYTPEVEALIAAAQAAQVA